MEAPEGVDADLEVARDGEEDSPTVIQPAGSLPQCRCRGNPHVGGQVPGLACLPWSRVPSCGGVRLSEWAFGNESCSMWVGSRYCKETPCPAEPTGFNWIIGTDAESKCTLQYVGAYQFDGSIFRRVDSSSFNCEGASPPQDLNPTALNRQLAAGQMWLPPYPGGSAEWVAGFTPYGTMARYADASAQVLALGGPAFMFVAKFSGELSHMAWYVLNQRTLLNGALCLNPFGHASGNCWACGYGEVDILEGNYCEPNLCMTLSNGVVNGYGSCLYGRTSREDTYVPSEDGESPLIAAVFDREGVTVYVNPVWEGLTATTAARELPPRPSSASKVVKAPGGTVGVKGMWASFQDTNQLQR